MTDAPHSIPLRSGNARGYYASQSAHAARRKQRLSLVSSAFCHGLLLLSCTGSPFAAEELPPLPQHVTRIYDPQLRPPRQAEVKPEPKLVEETVAKAAAVPVIEPPKLEPAPPVDESKIDLSAMEVSFNDPPGSERLPQVLARLEGFIAFGDPKDPEYATHVFKAPDWERVGSEGDVKALTGYCVYHAIQPYRFMDELRVRHNVPKSWVSYILFPRNFNLGLYRQVRQFAAQRGTVQVAVAVLRFSLTDPTGVEVERVGLANGSKSK